MNVLRSQIFPRLAVQSRRYSLVDKPGAKTRLEKLKAKQRMFQEDNGRLIHEKRGTVDRMLYQASFGTTVIILMYTIYHAVELSRPPKN